MHDDLKFRYRTARKKPLVTKRQKVNRLKFAKQNVSWNEAKCKRIVWSDEASFSVSYSKGDKVYMRPGSDPFDPKFTCKTVKFPQKLMIWGCFGYHGRGKLVFYPQMKQ